MTKIIPRDLIKHLEWKPGQPTAPVTPVINPVVQNTGSFNADNASYSFLEGDFGRQVLEEYNQLVQGEYQNASALQKLSFADDVIKGSNPFAFVLLNRVLQNHGKWVARPVDLERALKKEAINAISKLPESADIDDIMYRVYVIDKIKKGQEAIKEGKVVTVESLKEEMKSW